VVGPLPDVATKAPGITVETIEGADSAAVDSEGDPLGEDFVGFAVVDSIRALSEIPELLDNELSHTPQAGVLVLHLVRRIERPF